MDHSGATQSSAAEYLLAGLDSLRTDLSTGTIDRDAVLTRLHALCALAADLDLEPPADEAVMPVFQTPEAEDHHALLDPITNLPARTLLLDRLRQGIQLARRESEPLALLLLDLGNFDALQERLAPGSADILLRECASALLETLRASDTVARLGMHEFAILLPGANAIGALGTTKKIQRALSAPLAIRGQHVSLQARAGIALYPEHGEDVETLMERAAAAVAQARSSDTDTAVYAAG